MKTSHLNDFDFELPSNLIAQFPLRKRDSSKLLVFNKAKKTIQHESFYNLINLLSNNDILVFNNTKVIKSRLFCTRKSGGKIECFFLRKIKPKTWEVLLKKQQKLTINEVLSINDHHKIKIIEKNEKTAIVTLISSLPDLELLDNFGEIPLPPYIKTEDPNKYNDSYQTIFASEPGAVAAPTASLHFTPNIFSQLRHKSIDIIFITLHIGLGTFNPIQSNNINEHIMHKENYFISQSSALSLNNAIKKNKRIISVGTTVARCLESNINNNTFSHGNFSTSLFIKPGYKFKCINGLITNFHLPKSSLFILLSSFIGLNNAQQAYSAAKNNNYRFFSFGDAMFVT